MEERAYKQMGRGGAQGIALGVITIVFGCVTGVLLIISGAQLLHGRKHMMF